ncbi:DUF1003 domain-containing protein [Mucilaginibacter jinjuensis]|uniref:DUF1003 domain-containing protein n=1 Tax=Mucilaginibacter jinjuensis TaxID=1176721 RepID=A0ABY7TF45_9SPHI|nr:DUF1003 domain-containing protein [Mucilaginibacter jinjuensis]WCT14818.1 DUF1003 domain-containing protein [Mucilaginibacter jinjuensis]
MEKKSQQAPEPELKSSLDFTKTRTDHITVFIIDVLGSMKFLLSCFIIFAVWICWNINLFPLLKPFDPFPFPILEMAVSLFAIILSVSVLINQNRQGRIETIRQQVEFEANVRAEEEITKILNMVHEIHQRMGITTVTDQQLEEMKEPTDIKQIHKAIDDIESNESIKADPDQ